VTGLEPESWMCLSVVRDLFEGTRPSLCARDAEGYLRDAVASRSPRRPDA
jgi:hypothetical protein